MSKRDFYRQVLCGLEDWDPYLLQESGLPGPRGNLELAQAVVDEGMEELFQRYLTFAPEKAPTNSPQEFLAFCGVLGLGRLAAEGRREFLPILRQRASDPRWRSREAVAMALQRFGQSDMEALLQEMESWSQGNPLEQRAAAAALCEPALLHDKQQVERVLRILDHITASLSGIQDRRAEPFQVLKKGLAYCWSVAVAAHPEAGKKAMELWLSSDDPDVRWIMKENLKKKRLVRVDSQWAEAWLMR